MKTTHTRAQVESEMASAMAILASEMTRSSGDVFDAGVASGKEAALREVGFTLQTLKANLRNPQLSDSDFRSFVGTIVERLSQQCAVTVSVNESKGLLKCAH